MREIVRFIYFKELTHAIMEAGKSQNLQCGLSVCRHREELMLWSKFSSAGKFFALGRSVFCTIQAFN